MSAARNVVEHDRRRIAMDDHQVDSAVVVQVAGGDNAADNRPREIGRSLGTRQFETTPLAAQEQLCGARPGC